MSAIYTFSASGETSHPVSASNEGIYVAQNGDLIHLLADGTLAWKTAATVQTSVDPVESREGLVYTYCGNNLCAMNSKTGKIAWQRSAVAANMYPQCLVLDQARSTLLATLSPRTDTNSLLIAYSLSGEIRWSTSLVGRGSYARHGRAGCPVPTTDGLIITTHNKTACISSLNSNGKIMWVTTLEGFSSSAPVADIGGIAYLLVQGDGEQLLITVSRTGQVVHSIQVDTEDESRPQSVASPLLLAGKVFAVCGMCRSLYGFDTTNMQRVVINGSDQWFGPDYPMRGLGDTFLVATDNRLHCIGSDGNQLWDMYLSPTNYGLMAVSGGKVFMTNGNIVLSVSIDGSERLMIDS